MAEYGLNIAAVLDWTMPQLRLLGRYRADRQRDERKWQLTLAAGMMPQEAYEEMFAALDGKPVQHVSTGIRPGTQASRSGTSGHAVDQEGNVIAPGAPLLGEMNERDVRRTNIPIKSVVPERFKQDKEVDG